jgi:hypothetical protein
MSHAAVTFGLAAGLLLVAAPSPAPEAPRHLFYLHGRIVQEQQSARPVHPRFGAYELDAILDAFRARGFVVHGGIRPKSISVDAAAAQVVAEVRGLLDAGVPAQRIAVVGASMGAAIAIAAAAELGVPEVRYALLGACLSGSVVDRAARGGKPPRGALLSIREKSDETSEPCPAWRGDGDTGRALRVRELVVDTGLAHGFLYRPLPEWFEPVVEWALAGDTADSVPAH